MTTLGNGKCEGGSQKKPSVDCPYCRMMLYAIVCHIACISYVCRNRTEPSELEENIAQKCSEV
jgi:hypothetical protein